MSVITIIQPHRMSMPRARAAVQKVAEDMVADYEMTCEWHGDVLVFKRTGLSGTLALTESAAQLEMKLGIFLRAFAPKIREQVAGNMMKVFEGG